MRADPGGRRRGAGLVTGATAGRLAGSGPARLLAAALLAVAVALAGAAHAHATIVFATLEPSPNPPRAGDPMSLELEMVFPDQLPVEDAVVRVELTPVEGGETVAAEFQESEPGLYRTEVILDAAGEYRALMRDQTFRQEEARQTVTLTVGDAPVEPIEFVFPPTATGGNVGLWLIWLIGVPLLVGIVVTVVVLMGGRDDEDAAGA